LTGKISIFQGIGLLKHTLRKNWVGRNTEKRGEPTEDDYCFFVIYVPPPVKTKIFQNKSNMNC
jgi:hypothetical protein